MLGDHVLVLIYKDKLRVPAQELKALLVGVVATDSIPVVVIPVGITGILVDNHIVDEVIFVQQGIQFLVSCLRRQFAGLPGNGSDRFEHFVPRIECAFTSFDMVTAFLLNLNNVIVFLLTAKVLLAKVIVHTFSDIIKTPVHAIQEEVYIEGIHAGVTKLALHATSPYITCVLCPLTIVFCPMLPSVTEMAAQHQLIKLLRFIAAV